MSENVYQSIWPGLNSYTEDEQTRFFGRDKEIELLQDVISTEQLCTIYGSSGVGKTSLLLAGVFPKLRANGCLPVYLRLGHDKSTKPYAVQIVDACLAAAQESRLVVKETCPALNTSARETLWEWFHRHEFLNDSEKSIRPVLVIDQFEEVFTLGVDKAQTEGWFDELTDLCANCVPDVIVNALSDSEDDLDFQAANQSWHTVICLREDFLSYLEEQTVRYPIFRQNRISIGPLSRENAIKAVLRSGSALLNETVAQSIVNYVSGSSGRIEAPLLSLFCSRLDILRHKRGEAKLSMELVNEKKNDILTSFYDETMDGISESSRNYLEATLLNPNGFRMPLQYDAAIQNGVSVPEIEQLVKERVLHKVTRDGVTWVEFSHDILTPVARSRRDQRDATKKQGEKIKKLKSRILFWIWGVVISTFVAILFFCIAVQSKLAERHREMAIKNEKVAAQKTREANAMSEVAKRQTSLAARNQEIAQKQQLISRQSIDFLRAVFEMTDPIHGGSEDVRVIDVFKGNLSKIDMLEPKELRADMQCIVGSFLDNIGENALASNLLFSSVGWNIRTRPNDVATAYSLYCLSWWFLSANNDNATAYTYARKALEIYEKNSETNSLDIALVCNALGVFSMMGQKNEEAQKYLNRAFEIRCSRFGMKHPDVAVCYRNLGMLYEKMKRYDLAIKCYSNVLDIFEHKDDLNKSVIKALIGIGRIHRLRGEYAKAIENFNKAAETCKKRSIVNSKVTCNLYQSLGLTYRDKGDYRAARKALKNALKIAMVVYGPDDQKVKELNSNIENNEKMSARKKTTR